MLGTEAVSGGVLMSLSRGGGALRLGFVRFPAFRTDRRVESRFPRVFAGVALDGAQLILCVFFVGLILPIHLGKEAGKDEL